MPDYTYLQPLKVTAAADTTGLNAGNWTAVMALSGATISYLNVFECFKVTIDGPIGFGLSWFIDSRKWSHTAQGWKNEWDPQQPAPCNSGQTFLFFFEAPTTATPVPTVTAWFRYDSSLPLNAGAG